MSVVDTIIKSLPTVLVPENVTINKNLKKVEYDILGAKVGISDSKLKIMQGTYVGGTLYLRWNNFNLNIKL